ncbi:MAG: diaminopimelate epimerase [Planctomycetes bacterium]|nr:diaminopimelate epimerase [Planctomycetota bacterium]
MKFAKMHGIANDYVVLNGFKDGLRNPGPLAKELCDRRFGVGADGLLVVMPSKNADFRMRMFNPDGSEAEMCGNGIRCFGKYVFDHGLTGKKTITVETLAGTKTLDLKAAGGTVKTIRVDMGTPRLERPEIPMVGKGRAVNEELKVAGRTFRFTSVSMGNPHCVIFVNRVKDFPVTEIGPQIETHKWWPRKVNVEFVEVVSRKEVRQRTWERGAGETWGCGTGAAAVCVAGVLTGRTERKILNHLLGGDLNLEWKKDGHVFKTGPAVEVFEGEIAV